MNNYKRNSETWLFQLQKELNGKAMGDLAFELDKDLKIDPIKAYLFDQKVNESEELYEIQTPRNIQYIKCFAGKDNTFILEALEGGCGGIFYVLQEGFELKDLASLLNGVHLHLIEHIFDISASEIKEEEFTAYWNKEFVEIPIHIIDQSFLVNIDLDRTDSISNISRELYKLSNNKTLLSNLIFIKPHPHFFTNIAFIRAIRIILLSIAGHLELEKQVQIAVLNQLKESSGDFNQDLIAFTSNTLSSTIAGCEFIVANPQTDLNEPDKLRLLRNIPQLLSLESGMENWTDGIDGARNLNYMVEKITEEIWAKLKTL